MQTAEGSKEPSAVGAAVRYLPSWMRNLMPGAKHLVPEDPFTRPIDQPRSSEPAASTPGTSEDLKELEELVNMDVDGYIDYLKKSRAGVNPPRPRQPPMPRTHPEYALWQDMRRIYYLRNLQHERIASLMTTQEKRRVMEEGRDAAKDKALLQSLADRSGIYIDMEVKDCIHGLWEMKENSKRQWRYVKEFGMPFPTSAAQQREASRFMKAREAEEEFLAKLGKRDRTNCPLAPSLAWAGASATCTLTGLKYWECCGRKEKEESAPPAPAPHWLRYKPRENPQHLKSRAEGRLRRAYKLSKESRFQE